VWRAEHPDGRPVALKLLHQRGPSHSARLKAEFRRMVDVAHPNLATLYELEEEGEHLFFTMELVDGAAWTEALRGADWEAIRAALGQLCAGVAALHTSGLIHFDLKPSNVLVQPDGRVVVLDFGLARPPGRPGDPLCPGQGGTRRYMPPEQADGLPPSASADWYSVGMLLYEVVAGRLPTVEREGEIKVRRRRDVPPPSTWRPDVPDDLDRLCCALLDRTPGRRPRAPDLRDALGVQSSIATGWSLPRHELVGREDALAALDRTAGESPRPTIFELRGEPGIGKSALAREHLRQIEAAGALVFSGRCSERESISFQGFDTVTRALGRRLRAGSEVDLQTDSLAQLFPAFGPRQGEPGQEHRRTADEVRRRAVTQLAAALAAVTPPAGTTVFLDDLHWADADARWLLEELISTTAPVRLLLACRPEEANSSGLTDLLDRAAPGRHLLELGPIARDASAQLAASVLGPDAATEAAAEAGGVPLMVELLAATGRSTLTDAVASIVDAQEPDARSLAELIALAGGPIPTELALEAAELPGALQLLVRLRAARLVRSSSLRPGDPVEPWHDRIRGELVSSIDPDRARAHHERLARCLQRRGPSDPGLVGRHFAAAGLHDQAVGPLLTAGQGALSDLAFDRAIALLREAERSAEAAGTDLSPVLEALGEALEAAGRLVEAAPAFARAAGHSDDERAALLHCRAAEAWVVAGRLTEGQAAFKPALSRRDLRSARRPVLTWMGAMAKILWRGVTAPPREASTPAVQQRVDTLWSVARAHLLFDEQTAAPYLAASCDLALRAGDTSRATRGRLLVAMMTDQYFPKLAGRALDAATAQLEANPDPYLDRLRRLVIGITTYNRGLSAEALPHLDAVSEGLRGRATYSGWECAIAEQLADSARIKLGRVSELRNHARRQAGRAAAVGDSYASVYAALAMAWCDLAAGDPISARTRIDGATGRWSDGGVLHQQHWLVLAGRLRCDLAEGRPDVAEQRLRQMWPRIRKSYLLLVPETRVRVLRLYGRVLAALPADRSRNRDLRRTARKLGRVKRPEAAGGSAMLRAVLALRAGDRARASACLERSISGFEACGMDLDAAAVRRRLGHLMDDPAAADAARTRLRAAGISAPPRWLRLAAPGLDAT